jgi:hypothetical protein
MPALWNTFEADVSIRQSRITAEGKPAQISPGPSTLHFERTRTVKGWKTTITVTSKGPLIGQSGKADLYYGSPDVGLRIEDAGDGTPLRLFERGGKELPHAVPEALRGRLPSLDRLSSVAPPQPATAARGFSGDQWIEGISASRLQTGDRTASLSARYGKPVGRVNGFDRYLAASEAKTVEVLVERSSAMLVEMSVSEGGKLLARTTFNYLPYGPDRFVRDSIKIEQALAEKSAQRLMTEVRFSNVHFVRRGGAK